jgi:nicotinate phosphoribosyltransferase
LDPYVFDLPVEKIKQGFYSDKYFVRTREVLLKDGRHTSVVMQVFTRKSGILCGMDEAVAVLKLCSQNPEKLKINALYDGDSITNGETVLTVEGDYSSFAHLETVYLGALARGTSIATAVSETVESASGKPVMFFSARFDHYSVQSADGYAAYIGGADGVSTDANGFISETEGVGTIPHALIAVFDGNTLSACEAFSKHIDPEVTLIALVDFNNDCIGTSLKVARHFGRELWGVRLDTSGDMRDISVTAGGKESYGVTPELVWKLRDALDKKGFDWVRIVVSGGFDSEKIRRFNSLDVPFDAVGVGSAFYKRRINFTADVVMVEGRPCAKVGRSFKPNQRLEKA